MSKEKLYKDFVSAFKDADPYKLSANPKRLYAKCQELWNSLKDGKAVDVDRAKQLMQDWENQAAKAAARKKAVWSFGKGITNHHVECSIIFDQIHAVNNIHLDLSNNHVYM